MKDVKIILFIFILLLMTACSNNINNKNSYNKTVNNNVTETKKNTSIPDTISYSYASNIKIIEVYGAGEGCGLKALDENGNEIYFWVLGSAYERVKNEIKLDKGEKIKAYARPSYNMGPFYDDPKIEVTRYSYIVEWIEKAPEKNSTYLIEEETMDKGYKKITAKTDGNILWSYTSQKNEVTQYDHISRFFVNRNLVCLIENDTLVALDKTTGTQKWSVVLKDKGDITNFSVELGNVGLDATAKFYILGGKADLTCISFDGKALWSKQSLNKDFNWKPHSLIVMQDYIRVNYLTEDDLGKTYTPHNSSKYKTITGQQGEKQYYFYVDYNGVYLEGYDKFVS